MSSVHWGEGGREIHRSETIGWIANISGVLLANSYEPCIFAAIRWASVTAWRSGAILCVLALSWEFPWFKEMTFLPCSLLCLYFEPNASALLITRKENSRWRTWHSTMIGWIVLTPYATICTTKIVCVESFCVSRFVFLKFACLRLSFRTVWIYRYQFISRVKIILFLHPASESCYWCLYHLTSN